MNNILAGSLTILTLGMGLSTTVNATLYDRGNGMIYDSDQDITWLQDANYAYTSGYATANQVDNGDLATNNIFSIGLMGWDAAMTWTGNLVYRGYDDWRLPTITDNGDDGCNFSYNGTDCGYNVDISGSELAYMWYFNLGNKAYYDTNGDSPQSDWGLNSTSADGVDILNLFHYYYWSGTEYAPNTDGAWSFYASRGEQAAYNKYEEFFAWAVRDGDVPEPGTLLLLAAGLAGMAGAKRRRC